MTCNVRRDRVMSAVAGRQSDRVPFSFWYHFQLEHPSGRPLAEAEIAFAKKYDPDFLKVMHDLKLDLPHGMAVIEKPEDWFRLEVLDGRCGGFGEQIEALRLIRRELPHDIPIIDTVFNPFASANKLCGRKLMEYLHANFRAVQSGLMAICESLIRYTEAWISEGGDGIYYALDGAQVTVMSREEYSEIFLPLDRLILKTAMRLGTFNILHIHGMDIMFDILHDLPNHALSWSSRSTPPSLAVARDIHKGCLVGGIDEITISEKSPAEVREEVRQSLVEAGPKGFILAPGCAVPTDTPEENLFAIRQAVEEAA